MATIKSYTDISQSKKLAEILPLESADMYYISGDEYDICFGSGVYEEIADWICEGIPKPADIPCWSLAALLNIIPKHIKDYNVLRIDISENDTSIWYDEIDCGVNNELPDITKETAVDACVAMIEKMNELKML